MELLVPEIGLVVFQTIAFLLLMFVLAKFAWKPVLAAIKEREHNIDEEAK
ncbi:F0F1 ATP synthase subunit B family protein [Pedobacter sp. NJ-S-72]